MEQRNKQLEAQAQVDIWKYIFGFTDMALVRCAIELNIPDILENQAGRPMSLLDLSSAVGCPPSTLYRVMRFLVNRRIFHEETIVDPLMLSNSKGYVKTPLSCLLTKNGEKSMASFFMFECSPFKFSLWLDLSKRVLTDGKSNPFEASNDKDLYSFLKANPGPNKLFNEAMACDTRFVVPAVIEGCPEVFHGLESLVDVGGGNGAALRILVEAFPWIRGIVFDLQHVIEDGEKCVGFEYIAGDMFQSIPKADSVFLKWILHNWGDEECIKILINCKQAIHRDKGKVIIVDTLINEEKENESDGFEYVRLMMDMTMLSILETGKERTLKEWEHLLARAGFSRHVVHRIQAAQSVIVAYP
ncbi:acetylserotonin O-methyltransferase-like [Impatiens glandulifera]|uniref:acetylserotonin O-methyltransferase-like n=1 Tax=Impatiens glandulifera TaxID=253017 RepID=UPI001FB0C213|nr:acetylserotonin O-methyltransferase-like [Impatiens glandulifera]